MEETETVQGIENINILKGVRKDTASIKQEILKKKKKKRKFRHEKIKRRL